MQKHERIIAKMKHLIAKMKLDDRQHSTLNEVLELERKLTLMETY